VNILLKIEKKYYETTFGDLGNGHARDRA